MVTKKSIEDGSWNQVARHELEVERNIVERDVIFVRKLVIP